MYRMKNELPTSNINTQMPSRTFLQTHSEKTRHMLFNVFNVCTKHHNIKSTYLKLMISLTSNTALYWSLTLAGMIMFSGSKERFKVQTALTSFNYCN